ncbi:MAG TPA: hypothetical protein VN042_08515 [Asticcacaulis sp.]|jgi:hypothetical protein|nr:hypothetical protein [Asticcacaulis sp.]
MPVLMEHEYHERREAQERSQAEQATDEIARKLHNEMADHHASERARKAKLGLFKSQARD